MKKLLFALFLMLASRGAYAQQAVSIPDNYTSGSIAASGATNAIVIPVKGRSTVGLDVSGTWSGSLLVAASVDYATVGAASAHWTVTTSVAVTDGTIKNAITANGAYQINAGGFSAIRVYAASLVSGTAAVNMTGANGVSTFMADNPLPVNINQQTPGTTNLVQAGSPFKSTPTVTATTSPAYSIGDSIGGLLTLTVANNNGQGGALSTIRVTNIHADVLSLTVFLFDTNPTGVGSFACADNAAYVNDPAVVNSMITMPQNFSLAVPAGATYSYGSVDFTPPRSFFAGGSSASSVKTIYACIVTQTSFTANATTDFRFAAAGILF